MPRTSRPFGVLVAILIVCLFGAVGFRTGQLVRPSTAAAASTWHSAASASYSRARTSAYRSAWRKGYASGWQAGASAGETAAQRAGRAAGRAAAAVRAEAARTLARVLSASPHKLRRGVKTERCVPVAGGLCEVLGPAKTGKPCPRASVPYPEGGAVCVPSVLLRLSRTAA